LYRNNGSGEYSTGAKKPGVHCKSVVTLIIFDELNPWLMALCPLAVTAEVKESSFILIFGAASATSPNRVNPFMSVLPFLYTTRALLRDVFDDPLPKIRRGSVDIQLVLLEEFMESLNLPILNDANALEKVFCPMAVEPCPEAVVVTPIEVEYQPEAVVLFPIAVEDKPEAVVKSPIAVEPSPEAVELNPIAVEECPEAIDLVPDAKL